MALQSFPMAERRRARVLNVRLDDDEVEMLRELAEREGLSASDVVRRHIRLAWAGDDIRPRRRKK